jgi:hypothetical protein
VELLVSALVALLGAVGFCLGLRAVGGWVHLYRTRRRAHGSREASWTSIPFVFKGWYFTVPVFLGYAVVAGVVGVVLILR